MEHQVCAQSIAKTVYYRYTTETYEYECYTQEHCGKHACIACLRATNYFTLFTI